MLELLRLKLKSKQRFRLKNPYSLPSLTPIKEQANADSVYLGANTVPLVTVKGKHISVVTNET